MVVMGVVLDACVLYQAALRDTLLRASAVGLYRVHWSERILEEVRRNLVAKGRVSHEQIEKLLQAMQRAFPDAVVTDYEPLIDDMRNATEDRHVLAAAVAAEARIIVTHNLRDFPEEALRPHDVEALSPDAFLVELLARDRDAMTEVVRQQAGDLRSPPVTPEQLRDRLAKYAPMFVDQLRGS